MDSGKTTTCQPDDNRRYFLNLFMVIFMFGSFAFFISTFHYDNTHATPGRLYWEARAAEVAAGKAVPFFPLRVHYALPFYLSSTAWVLAMCFLSSFMLLLLSLHLHSNIAPLILFCIVLDFLLTIIVLGDCEPREIYQWYVCIPMLILYAQGARCSMIVAFLIAVQTTVLRFQRACIIEFLSIDCTIAASPFSHTPLGSSIRDCWLFGLLTMFCSCHQISNIRMLGRLSQLLAERELTNKQLQQATEAKSNFMANLTHELRTPMHGIIAMSSELKDMLPAKTEALNAVTIISDCADHLLSLVNDILDFERIECNHFELEKIAFSVTAEVQKVVTMLQFSAIKKQLDLRADIQVDHPFRIGDPVRFRQILFNLVSNAIKFTPDRGFVHISLISHSKCSMIDHRDLTEEVTLAVKDSGIGISKDDIPRLFKVDSSVSRRYGGSGLGLAICKRLCDLMGGTITCESELCKGSTFTVKLKLPLAKDAEGEAMDDEDEAGELQDEKVDYSKLRFDGLKVLLVEDNLVNQKVGKKMLTTLGCDVSVANNGVECMKQVEEKSFDVIFMDCQMPVMDGFQATQRLRELEKMNRLIKLPLNGVKETNHHPLPIIALTASATTDYRRKCLDNGMSDVLFKPLRREALAAALHHWTSAQPPPSSIQPQQQQQQPQQHDTSDQRRRASESSLKNRPGSAPVHL